MPSAEVIGAGLGASWSKILGENGWIISSFVQVGGGLSTPFTGGYNHGEITKIQSSLNNQPSLTP